MKKRIGRHFEGRFLGVAVFLFLTLAVVAGCLLWQNRHLLPPVGEVELHFFDVGQGDAALIRTPQGNVLLDTGEADTAKSLYFSLRRYGGTVECLILTHPHADHIGGAAYILENMHVKQVFLPRATSEESSYTRLLDAVEKSGASVSYLEPGMLFSLGEARFTVLAPLCEYENENDTSAVIRLDYGDTSALFTGDAEAASEADQLRQYGEMAGGFLDCDILKVAHHGSDSSSGENYLRAVTPAYAVISVGVGNDYGHPSRAVVARLTSLGCTIYRTDRSGTVVLVMDGSAVRRGR